MPFHKPLVQARQDELETAEARRRKDEAEEKAEEDNINERMALCDEKSACPSSPASPTEQPASPALAADELHPEPSMPAFPTEQPASPTLAADELQSSAAPPMPASPTEQLASPTLAADELQSSAVPSMPAPPTEQPAGYVSPDLAPPPPAGTKRKVLFSPVVECVNRLVNLQPADSTTRPIATPARRPEGSPLQSARALPRCETEVQDQIVANPPVVPMAASQTALVVVDDEPAGNSGAGQLLAEYYSMLVSCTTQVACAY
jgi:hypothetical protein